MAKYSTFNELKEDSFDDIEEDGYMDYGNDDIENECEDDDEFEDEDDDDMPASTLKEAVANKKEDEKFETFSHTKEDWINAGLGKEYPGQKYENEHALALFSSDDERFQREAIRYASYFAYKNNNDAKNFIVHVIQSPSLCASHEILDLATPLLPSSDSTDTIVFSASIRAFDIRTCSIPSPVSSEINLADGVLPCAIILISALETFLSALRVCFEPRPRRFASHSVMAPNILRLQYVVRRPLLGSY